VAEVLAVAFAETSWEELIISSGALAVNEHFLVVYLDAVGLAVSVKSVVSVLVLDEAVATGFAVQVFDNTQFYDCSELLKGLT